MKKKPVYLDYAAATPVSSAVQQSMKPYLADHFYNPSALYSGARDVKRALEEARSSIARSIGSRPSEVVFTAGGTESANLAVRGVMEQFSGSHLIISSVEHDAVRRPAQKYDMSECPVSNKGRIDVRQLKALINDNTALVSIMYANNEVGTVQPIKEVVAIVQTIRKERKLVGNTLPLYVHTDACQASQYLDINVARLGIDLMTLNGGKIYGPKQSGILYKRAGVLLSPQILGGGQELGMRSGTENVAACVGFTTALEKVVKRRAATSKTVQAMSTYFARELESRFGATVNGDSKRSLPNNIHVTFPGSDNERVLFSLDQQGVWAASGSACSASSDEPSHVLQAMNLSAADSRSSVRFSIGRETTREEIDYTLDALSTALKA